MIRRLSILLLVCGAAITARAQFGGEAGSFLRLGYGARGIGLGNAMTAYDGEEPVALYNPAATAFLTKRVASGSYSSLALDRTLNLLAVSAPIPVWRKVGTDSVRTQVSTIGVSAGLLNSGVSNIDSRDADGEQIGILSTYENVYYGSFSIRFRPNLSAGVAVRFFDAKLYDKVKSAGIAADLGALWRVAPEWTVGLVIQNINGGGYRWDTSPIYQQNGQVTEDRIPTYAKLGAAYHPASLPLYATLELEQSSVSTTVLRGGAEYTLGDILALRAGIDGYDLHFRLADQVHPSFGASVKYTIGTVTPVFNYAAVVEPVAGGLTHVIALGVMF